MTPNSISGGTHIPVVEQFKFLGLIFDRKLSFIPHIKALKAKCLKALDVIRVVANTDWGADRTVLLRLYRSLIRSKLDYGCIVYGSARPSYLRMLDPVHNQGLRLCLLHVRRRQPTTLTLHFLDCCWVIGWAFLDLDLVVNLRDRA